MAVYLDSSALVKLAVREQESAALRRYDARMATAGKALGLRIVQPR